MKLLFSILTTAQVVLGLGLCGLILVQQGKGADMGAAFGSGASGTLFGASGSSSFLSRTTSILAALFFAASLGIAYLASQDTENYSKSVTDQLTIEQKTDTPQESDSLASQIPSGTQSGNQDETNKNSLPEKSENTPDSTQSDQPKSSK